MFLLISGTYGSATYGSKGVKCSLQTADSSTGKNTRFPEDRSKIFDRQSCYIDSRFKRSSILSVDSCRGIFSDESVLHGVVDVLKGSKTTHIKGLKDMACAGR
ncbi:hypothetical protein DPMN_088994 [Dreissena polymorpha]|uniref:Uncharacterized protein n=1 Tax=Dreissena polymorpha TaxID=45954 RepID=A0A9D4QXT1_DREPO|nr:hypothetical protein DPMN_088994 [Dreissena polymorpha]